MLFTASFNCATFTASVSSLPAATPVIWRVITPLPFLLLGSPTAKAAEVDCQTAFCCLLKLLIPDGTNAAE